MVFTQTTEGLKMPDYVACGKQVLRGSKHFADAVSPEAALLIVLALGGVAEAQPEPTKELTHG